MSEPMGRQEIAEANQEWNDPKCFADWQGTAFAKETASDAYYEASEVLQDALKDIPAHDTERRNANQAQAWNHVDQKMDDEYQEYKNMHPSRHGYITETFCRIYPDGI